MRRLDDSDPQEIESLCPTCAHLIGSGMTCAAFPKGIPVIILLGAYDHHLSYDFEGLSDEGLTYVPKDEVTKKYWL